MTIRAKLAAALVPLAVISVALMTVLSRRAAQKILSEELALRARSLATGFNIEPALSKGLAARDEGLMLPVLQQIYRGGAAYAAAVDMAGVIVAHSNVAERGRRLEPFPSGDWFRRVSRREAEFIEVAAPIVQARPVPEDIFAEAPEPRRLGTLIVALPMAETMATAAQIERRFSAVVAAIMALNLALALLFLRKTLAPIADLVDGTRRLAKGELGFEISKTSADELGELTQSFNDMSATLAMVTVSKLFLDDIVNNMMDALVVTEADGRIRLLNPSAQQALAATERDWVGRPLKELLPQADEARRHGRASFNGEAEIRREEGSLLPVLFSGAPLSLREGGWAVTFRDITARKQAEEALAQKAEELGRSNKELEQFAYIASHDLQEPLRKVANFTQLLERRYKGKLGAEADEFIGFIVDGTLRMRALIQDLLTYSRSGRGEAPPRPVALDEAVKSALTDLEAAVREAQAQITVDPLPTVLGDKMRLTQVFLNLIGNAVKFRSRDRPCRVRVAAAPEGGQWRIFVEDNGIGIPEEHREKIFVIFQRLHSRAEYPGTGIGLAICRRIIESYGGRIWVENADPGARFVFTLPRSGVLKGQGEKA